MLLAALLAVAGQVGDLAESALKRSAEVKDSGTLLPGHGGLLDRMDSVIFGAPALWLALALMGLRFHR
jgi:phosphatidate cytidylyltransferase